MWFHKFRNLRLIAAFLTIFVYSRCSFEQKIHPDIAPVVEEFVRDAKRYGVEVDVSRLSSIDFGDITFAEDAVGLCLSLSVAVIPIPVKHSSKVVILDVYDRDSYQFKALVYHELAHCLLYKGHSDDHSLMAPTMHSECFYQRNWEPLLEELFTGRKTLKSLLPCFL